MTCWNCKAELTDDELLHNVVGTDGEVIGELARFEDTQEIQNENPNSEVSDGFCPHCLNSQS